MTTDDNPARALIAHFGDIRRTALAMGLSREQVRRWGIHGIPLERAIHVEQASKGVVSAEQVLAYQRALARLAQQCPAAAA